jgi:hypothetical protein
MHKEEIRIRTGRFRLSGFHTSELTKMFGNQLQPCPLFEKSCSGANVYDTRGSICPPPAACFNLKYFMEFYSM